MASHQTYSSCARPTRALLWARRAPDYESRTARLAGGTACHSRSSCARKRLLSMVLIGGVTAGGNDRENDQAAPGSTTGPRPSDSNRSSWSVDSRRRSEAVVLDHIARDVDRYAHGVLFKDVVQVAAASLEQDVHQGSPRRVGGPTDPVGPPGTVRWLCVHSAGHRGRPAGGDEHSHVGGERPGRMIDDRAAAVQGAHHGRSLPAGRRAGA
jgi:hypothetical protein